MSKKKATKKKATKKKRKTATGRMEHVIHVHTAQSSKMFSNDIRSEDKTYLRDSVIPVMEPLSDEDYMTGPVAILETAARFSYVLVGVDAYWCVEWNPGLLVIRFSPTGKMAWAAFNSPIPNFGGRHASDEDLEAWDEDAHNPQYTLVFDAWDAQFDEQERKSYGWKRASGEVAERWQAALQPANELYSCRFGGKQPSARHSAKCRKSPIWRGEKAMG